MKTISAVLVLFIHVLTAQIPKTIAYQGIVTDANGTAKSDGSYTFTFRLFDVASGGTALWTESNKLIAVEGGLFNTALGDQTSFPPTITFDQPYWLDIQVDGEQLSDRVALLSVPYSIRAVRADTTLIVISPEEAPYGSLIKAQFLKVINPSGRAADFTTEGGGSDALSVYNNGTGNAAQFTQGQPNASSPAVNIVNNGVGEALYLVTNENTNSDPVIYAMTYGTGYAGYFDGDIYTTGSYQNSDIRWKHKIKPLGDPLNIVLSLRGVQFEWNRDVYPERNFNTGKQYGFIAQEVEKLLPEMVRDDRDGFKAVDYQKMTAFLVEAIKEQQAQFEELKAAVSALQAQSALAFKESN
ncbi:MAG: tail fiber domain-containing protein [Candidatus Marinimicrobia bacterium]|nr:tail fiber domain-containing protein [Candidatus Neomarinimicrobiota bacterium]